MGFPKNKLVVLTKCVNQECFAHFVCDMWVIFVVGLSILVGSKGIFFYLFFIFRFFCFFFVLLLFPENRRLFDLSTAKHFPSLPYLRYYATYNF